MKLLLAEDDPLLADALLQQLGRAGYAVQHAPNGAVAEYLLEHQPFDIAVLDLGLPMVDGLTVLQRLRRSNPGLPVLLLSARDALDDRVAGFEAGADDYVTKPFDWPELQARLQALLRRSLPQQTALQWQGLVLEPERRRATHNGTALELSGREWSLLNLLIEQRGNVVTKDQIAATWSGEGAESGPGNTIEVYIHRLRRKLEGASVLIRTVRGLGYLMEAETP
ncbi:response regulators consisting of a CheY-like receiver domain and a winged-helix DNA-binding domain [Serpentinimonas raichei]|jgi:two-component system OmpR family response regulator|uniref:Response regulators consisting of a CheY-like receiver domain and a winged-helix DNA-binding domain n=1 Tax=Serpentinimonas raichei TaxID=1458425 RepID=A0A060NPF0_9BURK|nr:response regulator transcription factor [Serpentinimonas raichei]BAO80789.1 response regulators consisting of a CheY-like receiver domain and a winged-helix DNA-binding domain [Serpentinimonas raichei]